MSAAPAPNPDARAAALACTAPTTRWSCWIYRAAPTPIPHSFTPAFQQLCLHWSHTSWIPGASTEWTSLLQPCPVSQVTDTGSCLKCAHSMGFCATGVHNRKKGSSTIHINLIIPGTASPHSTQPPLHCLLSHAAGTSQPLFPKQAQENQVVTDTKLSV